MELDEIKARNQHLRADLERIYGAKDAEIAALQAELETIKARTAQAIEAAKALLAEQDPDKLRAGMASIVQFAQAPEVQRKIVEAEAKLAADAAEIERLKALAG